MPELFGDDQMRAGRGLGEDLRVQQHLPAAYGGQVVVDIVDQQLQIGPGHITGVAAQLIQVALVSATTSLPRSPR